MSAAAEQVSANVESVSAGSTEMAASIREIARSSAEGATVAAEAVHVAHATRETRSKLGESSAHVGEVVRLITSIAEQNGRLTLNATIEAARAGEAGRPFAIVASEVKDPAARDVSIAAREIGPASTRSRSMPAGRWTGSPGSAR